MSRSVVAFLTGIAGILTAKIVWPMVTSASVAGSFFPTDELTREFRRGFEEVSPNWDGWVASQKKSMATARRRYGSASKDSLSRAYRRMAARAVVEYSTNDEIAELYRWRASTFMKVAADRQLNGLCVGTQADIKKLSSTYGLSPMVRLAGRAVARERLGHEAWLPFDLTNDEAVWGELSHYLKTNEMASTLTVLSGLAEQRRLPNEQVCTALAALYQKAADHPNDRVGRFELIELVRSLDAMGAQD